MLTTESPLSDDEWLQQLIERLRKRSEEIKYEANETIIEQRTAPYICAE